MKLKLSKRLLPLFVGLLSILIYSQQSSACDRGFIDKLASRIEGKWSQSASQMRAAVAGARVCAGDSQMLAYAARAFAQQIDGKWSYAVPSSQELAKLCDQDPICGVALVQSIGRAIDGKWSYSVGMAQAIQASVVRNPFRSVQCAAIEAITDAADSRWSYSNQMSDITVEIAMIPIDRNH